MSVLLNFLKVENNSAVLFRQLMISAVMLLLCGGLSLVSLFPKSNADIGTKEKAVVLSVDNSRVQELGLIRQGEQFLEIEIKSGIYKGKKFPAVNQIRANLELDKVTSQIRNLKNVIKINRI